MFSIYSSTLSLEIIFHSQTGGFLLENIQFVFYQVDDAFVIFIKEHGEYGV